MKQLKSFQPMVGNYRKSNMRIVAVGLDNVRGLRESLATMGDQGFDFPLLSDRKLRVFREWLAFDDFERAPLHGTFLIDGKGRLRWQDIRHEPFVEPAWLHGECTRLLEQDAE